MSKKIIIWSVVIGSLVNFLVLWKTALVYHTIDCLPIPDFSVCERAYDLKFDGGFPLKIYYDYTFWHNFRALVLATFDLIFWFMIAWLSLLLIRRLRMSHEKK